MGELGRRRSVCRRTAVLHRAHPAPVRRGRKHICVCPRLHGLHRVRRTVRHLVGGSQLRCACGRREQGGHDWQHDRHDCEHRTRPGFRLRSGTGRGRRSHCNHHRQYACGAVLPVVFSQKVAAVFACAEGRALRHAHCRARVLCRLPNRHFLRADVCFNHCAQPDSGRLRQRARCGDRHRVQSEYVHHLPANGPCKRCTADFRLQLRCG